MRPLNQIDFVTTDLCPLRCDFCYAGSRRETGKPFSRENAERTREFLFAQLNGRRAPEAKWSWMGGEPLVAKDELRETVEAWRRDHGRRVRWQFKIVSNLVLLNEDFARWLGRRVYVHVSTEGCPEAQNMTRRFPDGSGTAAIFAEKAKLLFEHTPWRTARATVTPQNVRLTGESLAYLYDLGFREFSMQPQNGYDWQPDELDALASSYRDSVDFWLDHLRAGEALKIYWLDQLLQKIWFPLRDKGLCDAARGRAGVDADGNLWPCAYFIGQDPAGPWLLGHTSKGYSDQGKEIVRRVHAYNHRESCGGCEAVNLCRRPCLFDNATLTGDMFTPPSWFCEATRAKYREAMRAHDRAVRGAPGIYIGKYRPNRNGKGGVAVPVKRQSILVMEWSRKPTRQTRAIKEAFAALECNVGAFPRDGERFEVTPVTRWIKQHKPEWCIAFQRLYPETPGERIILDELRAHGTGTLFMDYGLDTAGPGGDHYRQVIFDPDGANATSKIAGGLDDFLKDKFWAQAIEAHLPAADLMAKRWRERADTCKEPPDVRKPFALLILQQTGDNTLLYDAPKSVRDPERLARDFIAVCKRRGIFAVIKKHPFDGRMKWNEPLQTDDYKMIGRLEYGPVNDVTNAWLMANAERVVVVNSTMLFAAMALDRPIAQLGRGWASGNGIVFEAAELDMALGTMPATDRERRRQFLALMLSRQAKESELSNPATIQAAQRAFYAPKTCNPRRAVKRAPQRAATVKTAAPTTPNTLEPEKPATAKETALPAKSTGTTAVIYLGLGRPHWEAAIESIRSLRRHNPGVRVALVTNIDDPPPTELQIERRRVEHRNRDNRDIKTRIDHYLPDGVETAVYIDADTIVTKSLDPLLERLVHHDFVCCQDPHCPTIGQRAKRRSPQITADAVRELLREVGPEATMPQAGLLAWRRNDKTRQFFGQWHRLWQMQQMNARNNRERGDSAAFATTLYRSDFPYSILKPDSLHSDRGSGAMVEHRWGQMSRETVADKTEWPPILSTVHIPEKQFRYGGRDETIRLVKRCLAGGPRWPRVVGFDSAPDDLVEWFEMRGHRTFRLDGDPGRRMKLLLDKGREFIPESAPLMVTIEMDCIAKPESLRRALDLFATLPDDVAALVLRSVDEQGHPVSPLRHADVRPDKRPPRHNLGPLDLEKWPDVVEWDHAMFNCTIWRTEAFRQIEFTRPSVPPVGGCDMAVGRQLRKKGWRLCVHLSIPVIHYPHASYIRRAQQGRE